MLSDLGDSGKPCLPDSIFDMKESHIVEGVYSVQMQYLLDICECELSLCVVSIKLMIDFFTFQLSPPTISGVN